MLQDIPAVLPDSIPSKAEEIQMLKSLPVDELINKVISSMVTLAINVTIAVIVFIIGRYIIKKIHALLGKIMVKRNVDKSLCTFVLSLVKMVLYFILAVTVIGILGIETSSFIAIFASAGVAMGMALSGTLQNFAGGVLILMLKPYRVGDFIEVNGYSGIVKEIQIFNTIIVTVDNKSIIIPNGGLSTGSINNYSKEPLRRVDWTVAISYGDDVDTARRVILEILNSDDRVLDHTDAKEVIFSADNPSTLFVSTNREPVVLVNELGDSSVNLVVRAWTMNSNYWNLYFDINERFYKQLPEHGIHFPFPQMDVHIDSKKA